MEIRAYDEIYLDGAQSILGHAVDFAVMTLDIPPNRFGQAFAVSDCSRQFAAGNPSYIAGMNGCELARAVLDEVHIPYPETEDVMYTDKSPEYWAPSGIVILPLPFRKPSLKIPSFISPDDVVYLPLPSGFEFFVSPSYLSPGGIFNS